ncbi:MAG TPA: permease-like cell division protein FtsX [Pseudonocardiaceae bacterium]|jgi:cell division transport system permease protein|nr:permease-like cell division protein FtsX [Pseudonocardiaceae bacterium]
MRASFVFGEVVTGLRRNVTMTVAMILTTAISLGLLGGGLLVVRTIDRMQEDYYQRVETVVYLSADVSANDPGCTSSTCSALRGQLESTSGVQSVIFESRQAAYARFQRIFQGQPELLQLARPEALPASLRVQLSDPARFPSIAKAFTGKPGVDRVTDQGEYLRQLFRALNGLRNATFVIALIQALAALLLISNTIQLSAFTRRTEVGVMRLTGASRWYTQLPFLLEAVVAGVVGAVLAVAGLVIGKVAFVDRVLAGVFEAAIVPRLGYGDIFSVAPILLLVGAAVAALTGYLTLRLYVRN